jgi:hypothetical protein
MGGEAMAVEITDPDGRLNLFAAFIVKKHMAYLLDEQLSVLPANPSLASYTQRNYCFWGDKNRFVWAQFGQYSQKTRSLGVTEEFDNSYFVLELVARGKYICTYKVVLSKPGVRPGF